MTDRKFGGLSSMQDALRTQTLGGPVGALTGSGSTGGSGTPERIAKWATATVLGNSNLIGPVANLLTLEATGTSTLTVAGTSSINGTLAGGLSLTLHASMTLYPSSPAYGDVLFYNDGTGFWESGDIDGLISGYVSGGGGGTAGRVAQWTSNSAIGNSNLIGPAANLLTLEAAAGTITLTTPATGTAALGTGAATRVAYWSDANTLASDAALTYASNKLKLSPAAADALLYLSGSTTQYLGVLMDTTITHGTDDIYGLEFRPSFTPTTLVVNVQGVRFQGFLTNSSQRVVVAAGGYFRIISNASYSGTNDYAIGVAAGSPVFNGSKASYAIGIYAYNQGVSGVNTAYGMYITTQTGASANYSIYGEAGLYRFGDQ